MKKVYRKLEMMFEKLTSTATSILGNSVTFIIALFTVIFWINNEQFYTQSAHQKIGDIILGITFLSLFIIQKSNNRSSASLHLKLNELIVSNETASNTVIAIEEKTEHEISVLTKEYVELAKQLNEEEEKKKSE